MPTPPSRSSTIAALVLLPWLVFAVVRVAGFDTWSPMTALIAFTPAVAVLSLTPIVVALILRSWGVAAIGLAVTIVLAATVAPRAIGDGASDVASSDRFVVMTANLKYGRANPEAIARLVAEHEVDVLSLQELTPESAQRLRAGLRNQLPGQMLEPRIGAGGSGLMTRRPLQEKPRREEGAAQPEAEVRVPGAGSRVKAVHPPPPIEPRSVSWWTSRIDAMPPPYEGETPRILAGDFNSTLDHSKLRELLDRGYSDAADETGDGLRATYPARRLRPGIAIDHILVPDRIAVVSTTVVKLPGSDHRAVIAVLGPAPSS